MKTRQLGDPGSGYCNRCGFRTETRIHAWCEDCHKKVKAELHEKLSTPCGINESREVNFITLLHTGDIWWYVSPEEKRRRESGSDKPHKSSTARSKMFRKDARRPSPVDMVALKIAPQLWKEQGTESE